MKGPEKAPLTTMPKDKLLHIKYSFLVAIGTLVIYAVGKAVTLHTLSIMLLIGGISAGVAVEAAQRSENMAMGRQVHEVSIADAVCSAAIPILLSIIFEIASRFK